VPDGLDRPVVASVHQRPGGLLGRPAERRERAELDLRLYRRADAVVVPSEHLRRLLARDDVPARTIHVVEPGSDGYDAPDRLDAPRAERDRSTVAFISVANLSPHKRPLELLDAFACLGRLDASLTLVGGASDTMLAAAVRDRLARPDLAGRARWMGPAAPGDVARLLRTSDVFVTPARHESYGIAVAEALRAGLPAVVCRSGNLPHLLRDRVDAFVVPARDLEAFAAAMRRLATDAPLRARMSDAARHAGERRPGWDDAAARFVGALRSAQARAGRSAA
jgi:glycosyltransferase involved in cell wall biosynthesis